MTQRERWALALIGLWVVLYFGGFCVLVLGADPRGTSLWPLTGFGMVVLGEISHRLSWKLL